MTIEELMQILPTLNAAIIAHDWLPSMQRRQKELKNWLQINLVDHRSGEASRKIDKDLGSLISQSGDLATTFCELFDLAKGLQNENNKRLAAEIDQAHAQRSEAMIALARHVTMHSEKCAQYDREREELKDKMDQSMNVLRNYIHTHLGETLDRASHGEVQEVFNALVEADEPANYSTTHVRSDIYRDLQVALRKSNDERDGMKEVCTEQMATIRQQSQDLDEYIVRMAKVINLVQDKERENQKLRDEIQELRQANQAQEDAVKSNQRDPPESERQMAVTEKSSAEALGGLSRDEIFTLDAEITNLRRKLERAYTREKGLQDQIRQLLQASQTEQAHTDKPPSRIKRLLGGQQKSSSNIPTMNSMQNLSQSIFTPFSREKPLSPMPLPPSQTEPDRALPSSIATDIIDPWDPPPPSYHKSRSHSHSRSESPPQPPPRLREVTGPQQQQHPRSHPNDEIDTAVSSRFRQQQQQHTFPSNLISTALTSTSRGPTPTPTTSSQASLSFEDVPDYPSYQLGRVRPRNNASTDLIDPHMSFTQYPAAHSRSSERERQTPVEGHMRVLSGITEVTEDTAPSMKTKKSDIGGDGSPDSIDRRMYQDT
ncbi:hypothetical protein LTR05_007243 [Lithohypha guttulata]|uniref:Uncharacterized protein n=1 Tax=Lithohypha guttulata TaxID=1690604 RepID=A0AAN7SUP9_9EURO|nr:hypothetical protein LTR05_007243 [Lithohypha guttulata]